MTDLIDNNLLNKIQYLKDNYQGILERLSDIGACSTLEKIKKDCGLKITILDELVSLVDNAPGIKDTVLVDKVYEIIRRGFKQDERNAIIQVDLLNESSDGPRIMEDLFNMYKNLSDINSWKTSLISSSYSKKSLLKNLVFKISGKGIVKYLKYESGIHEALKDTRRFRIAVTVYPETYKKDFEIKENEIKTETYRSSGPGGQSANTSDSAVRLTHIPSGISASSQSERSQKKNKDIALQILSTKIIRAEEEKMIKQKKARRDEILFGYDPGIVRTYDYDKKIVYSKSQKDAIREMDDFINGGIDIFLKEKIKDEEIKKIDSFFLDPESKQTT